MFGAVAELNPITTPFAESFVCFARNATEKLFVESVSVKFAAIVDPRLAALAFAIATSPPSIVQLVAPASSASSWPLFVLSAEARPVPSNMGQHATMLAASECSLLSPAEEIGFGI
jgi:hypothetical protein